MAAAAVAAVVAGSAGISLISIDAVPGDSLYSTKRAVERAVAVFDGDVIAEHRVGELESLITQREDPGTVKAAQLEASAALAALATDHPLQQMLRRLVLGSAPLPYYYEQEVDWHGGDTFDTSLPDGNLLYISHVGGQESASIVELTVTGSWYLTGSSGQWQLSDRPPDDLTAEATVFMIRVDPSGVSITLREEGSGSSNFDRLSDAIRESQTDEANPAGPEATTSTTIPEIGAPATDSGFGNPAGTSLTTTVSPTTTSPTVPSTKPTTTTSGSTTTTKVVTTTRSTTTTTTTTTQPTTTTTDDDDDDDDDDD